MHNLVSVRLRCGSCGAENDWCVRVSRNVPGPLRCQPRPGGGGGGGGPSDVRCPKCGHRCFDSIPAFERAVETAISGSWGPHQKAGAVVIDC